MDHTIWQRALWRVIKALEEADDEMIECIARRGVHLEASSERESGRKAGISQLSSQELHDLSRILGSMKTREEGLTYLENKAYPGLVLRSIAQHLDIPILTRDTVAVMRDKIIEATIGYQLRSKAIRGYSDA